jgi:predicted ribosomally synthesized peptide with nif11-like leader
MSTTEIERLVRDYGADQALRGRIDAAPDGDQVTQIAREAGYDVTPGEVRARLADQPRAATELTGRQLDAVAGGSRFY